MFAPREMMIRRMLEPGRPGRLHASFWCSPRVVLRVAAVRQDDFSRDPPRIIRGKKYGHARDALGLADAAQRRTRGYLLLNLPSHSPRVRLLRFGSTGTASVTAAFSCA